jgi:hypothetical protein
MRELVDTRHRLTGHRAAKVEVVGAVLSDVVLGKTTPASKCTGSKASALPLSMCFQPLTGAHA